MAFTTTTGANGVVSLVGTSGVDADAAIIYSSNVSIEGFGDNDLIGILPATGQGFVSGFTVIGGQGNDQVTVATNLVNSAIWGDNIETVDGTQIVGSGNDTILIGGGLQASTILGLGGNDTITIGPSGNGDMSNADVNGNAGIDTITVNATNAGITQSFIRGGQDFDTITVRALNLVGAHINGNKFSDNITVTVLAAAAAGNSVISDSTIFGGQGDDTITATADLGGASTVGFNISGDLGNDFITASIRKDTILGGDGDDTIIGGAEADTMTGGAGKNTFAITTGTALIPASSFASTAFTATSWTFGNGVDIVTDFKGGANDTIAADGVVGPPSTITATSVRGVWNSSTSVFTANLAGGDWLVSSFAAGAAGTDSIVLLGAGASAPVIV